MKTRFTWPRAPRSASRHRRHTLKSEVLEIRSMMHGDAVAADHEPNDHIHAQLSIIVNSQETSIPANLGVDSINGVVSFVHTHGADNHLHIHSLSNGQQPEDFITLDDFFDTWRTNAGLAGNNPVSNFDATHVFDYVADATHPVHLYVNGEARSEFENYVIEDGDDIVITYGSFVELAPLPDVTVLSGAPLQVPLDGFSTEGAALSFSISTTNSNLSATTNSDNRSWKINVTHAGTTEADTFSGSMTFELFEDRAPRVTSRIIELTESDFYTNSTFHRVDKDFVIQGGIGATGTPAATQFDDQFHADLQHTGVGLLSMAKTSDDDSNTSQFFVTANPARHLDFIHSVFGRLTEGEDIRQLIANTPVQSNPNDPNSKPPLTPVNITSAEVFYDTQNRVLTLSAPAGVSGTSDVTVTVSDGLGHTAQRTFKVTITPDANNNTPFLLDIPDIHATVNTPVTFQLPAVDVEGDPIFYANAATSGNLTLVIDSATGASTLTPKNGFMGVEQIFVGVRSSNGNNFDTQAVPVLIAPAAPTGITLSAISDTGTSSSDGITDLNNSSNANRLQFVVSGVVNGMEVSVYDGSLLLGTAIASGGSATVTTNGTSVLTPGAHLINARQTLKNQALSVGNRTGSVDVASNVSAGVIVDVTNWTNGNLSRDVNHNGFVDAADALIVIDELNIRGSRQLASGPPTSQLVDVNGDRSVSPADALSIIDVLNGGSTAAIAAMPNNLSASANSSQMAAVAAAVDLAAENAAVDSAQGSGAALSIASGPVADPGELPIATWLQPNDAGTQVWSADTSPADPLDSDLYDAIAPGIAARTSAT